MSAEYVWGAIFIMMGVTYISRIIPFLLLAGKPVPRWFKTWLTYVPTAIFGALVLPDVFLSAGSLGSGTEQPVPVVDRHHLPAGL